MTRNVESDHLTIDLCLKLTIRILKPSINHLVTLKNKIIPVLELSIERVCA